MKRDFILMPPLKYGNIWYLIMIMCKINSSADHNQNSTPELGMYLYIHTVHVCTRAALKRSKKLLYFPIPSLNPAL